MKYVIGDTIPSIQTKHNTYESNKEKEIRKYAWQLADKELFNYKIFYIEFGLIYIYSLFTLQSIETINELYCTL